MWQRKKVVFLGATAAGARKWPLSPVAQGLPQGGHTLENPGGFVFEQMEHSWEISRNNCGVGGGYVVLSWAGEA